jgi:hypothetical protein
MTVYTVTGHILGPPPDGNYVEPETLRAALQTQGVGTNVTLTLSGSDDTGHKNHGALK